MAGAHCLYWHFSLPLIIIYATGNDSMGEVIGILVFTQNSILEHKLRDGKCSEDRYCYWTTKRFPNKFLDDVEAEARLYFAIDKQVKGYFVITGLYDQELRFCSEDWVPIENGEILAPSQGWRYYTHPD